MLKLSTNVVFQNAWVVGDLDAALDYWTGLMGVGPFFGMEWTSGDGFRYRGAPGRLDMQVFWAQAGDVQIELIDVRSEEPNVYRDLVPAGETRFHHVCFWSEDYERDIAAMEAAGYPLAMAPGDAPTRFAYFDCAAEHHQMIEILERDEAIAGTFAKIAEIGRHWDGTRPVRRFEELFAG
mgnify:FL=1